MSDREEKVLKGLECCTESISKACPMECPFWDECMTKDDGSQMYSVMHAALELLKHDEQTIESLERTIDKLTKALAEKPEQKHGHWVSVPDKSPKTTTINMYSFICSCSECGKAVGPHAEYNYCPGCGAMMDEEVKQDVNA